MYAFYGQDPPDEVVAGEFDTSSSYDRPGLTLAVWKLAPGALP